MCSSTCSDKDLLVSKINNHVIKLITHLKTDTIIQMLLSMPMMCQLFSRMLVKVIKYRKMPNDNESRPSYKKFKKKH